MMMKRLMTALRTFYIRKQHARIFGCFGYDYGFGFKWDTRDMYYFHDYMGWQNLSERHRRDQCTDAYCQWHGTL